MIDVLIWIGLVIACPILFGVAIGYAGIVRQKRQFSLGELLIITTIIAMCLGVTVYALKRIAWD